LVFISNFSLCSLSDVIVHNYEIGPTASQSYRNHNVQTSQVLLKHQVQGTNIFASAVSNQKGCPEDSPWKV